MERQPEYPPEYDDCYPEPETKEMTVLGYINGWGEDTPEIVKECRLAGHFLRHENLGRCLNKYTCTICRYTYKVDSSD